MPKIVIQCAGNKVRGRGYLRDQNGRSVLFVSDPGLAPHREDLVFAHPDGMRTDGQTWRQYLVHYNTSARHNPDRLLSAIDLYGNPAYENLRSTFNAEDLFILSAGWGLVRSDFLLPQYDITFSNAGRKTPHIFRKKSQRFSDLNFLPPDDSDELFYVGGKDYIPLFCALTKGYRGRRSVFFNSEVPPGARGCRLIPFLTNTRTNWHYSCANRICQAYRNDQNIEDVRPALH